MERDTGMGGEKFRALDGWIYCQDHGEIPHPENRSVRHPEWLRDG
jgi:hypothetical protein